VWKDRGSLRDGGRGSLRGAGQAWIQDSEREMENPMCK
jgi:hypothetical protein